MSDNLWLRVISCEYKAYSFIKGVDTVTENEITAEELPVEDDTELLASETKRRRKEGRADDSAAMQAAVCLILSIALVLLNTVDADTAGELFSRVRELSADTAEIIPDPIELIINYFNSR